MQSLFSGLFVGLPLYPLFVLMLAAVSLSFRALDDWFFMRLPPEGTEAYAFAQREERLRYLDYMLLEGSHHGDPDYSQLLREANQDGLVEQKAFEQQQKLQQQQQQQQPLPAAVPPQQPSERDIKALLTSFTSSKFYRHIPTNLDASPTA